MNIVVLAGRVTSLPHRSELSTGEVRWSFDLTTDTIEGAPPAAVPVVCDGRDSLALALGTLAVGDLVVVSGRVRRRFFRTGGVTQSRTEVVADHLVPQRLRQRVRKLLEADARRLGASGMTEVSSTGQRAGVGLRADRRREQES